MWRAACFGTGSSPRSTEPPTTSGPLVIHLPPGTTEPPAPVPSSGVRSTLHATDGTGPDITPATIGRRSRFGQLRPNLLSTLVRLEPGRPSYALGLRTGARSPPEATGADTADISSRRAREMSRVAGVIERLPG